MPTLCIYEKGSRKRPYRKNERVLIRKTVINTHISMDVLDECGLILVFTKPKRFGDRAKNLVGPLIMGLSVIKSKSWADTTRRIQAGLLVPVIGELIDTCNKYPMASIRIEGL